MIYCRYFDMALSVKYAYSIKIKPQLNISPIQSFTKLLLSEIIFKKNVEINVKKNTPDIYKKYNKCFE